MSPRRSARPSADASAVPVQPAILRDPASTAYNIIEIRREILRLLSPADLASFMRVEKGCMRDVAAVLYREVRFERVEAQMSKDADRQEIYASSVVEVDARSMIVSVAMQRDPRWKAVIKGDSCDGPVAWEMYSPEVFDIVVPPLRQALPHLRRIQFGSIPCPKYGPGSPKNAEPSCTVYFGHPSPPSTLPLLSDAETPIGTLQIRQHRRQILNRMPLKSLEPYHCLAPTGAYLLQHRYNLVFYGHDCDRPGRRDLWIEALLDGRFFDNMSTSITIDHLPITLDQLSTLCERRLAHDSSRFEKIAARALIPCDIDQFRRFAAVASTSLTSLVLTDERPNPASMDASLSYRDLPALLPLIRAALPNLVALEMEIAGLDENQVASLLVSNGLETKGSIRDLRITTSFAGDEAQPPAFNIIRVLSRICAPAATISITSRPDDYLGPGPDEQTAYLHYLQRQPPYCQRHLATIDFDLLGISTLAEVDHLNYDPDGQPFLATESRPWTLEKSVAARWASTLPSLMDFGVDTIDYRMKDHTSALLELDRIASTAPTWEKLAKAQLVLEAAEELKAEIRRMDEGVEIEEVRQYIESLKLKTG